MWCLPRWLLFVPTPADITLTFSVVRVGLKRSSSTLSVLTTTFLVFNPPPIEFSA